jgi:hypothetical protein
MPFPSVVCDVDEFRFNFLVVVVVVFTFGDFHFLFNRLGLHFLFGLFFDFPDFVSSFFGSGFDVSQNDIGSLISCVSRGGEEEQRSEVKRERGTQQEGRGSFGAKEKKKRRKEEKKKL